MSPGKLPHGFHYGFATASFQIEGATSEDGRAPSIWDEFSRTPGKTLDGVGGDVTTDSYHRYKEDIAILKSLGATSYRISLSWSRIIPLGGAGDPINAKGIEYYNAVIDELLKNGITPFLVCTFAVPFLASHPYH